MSENEDIPAPGSPESVIAGCCCPRIDNSRGRGYMGGVKDDEGNTIFVINGDCPLHGFSAQKEQQ